MTHVPKICPRCGEEYVQAATTCVDCGVPLGYEGPAAAPEPPPLDLGPVEHLVALRNAEVSWIDGLAAALADAGIPCRVELPEADDRRVQGRGMGALRCTLYVRREDVPAAARVDAAFARTQVPDLPEDADAGWEEADTCPGCGAHLAADADECPDCGLGFAGPE